MTLSPALHAVSISIPLLNVKSALEYLLNIQMGVALAIATLGQVGAFDSSTVLDGVADIFAAIAAMTDAACSHDSCGVDTTVVLDGVVPCSASTTQ